MKQSEVCVVMNIKMTCTVKAMTRVEKCVFVCVCVCRGGGNPVYLIVNSFPCESKDKQEKWILILWV